MSYYNHISTIYRLSCDYKIYHTKDFSPNLFMKLKEKNTKPSPNTIQQEIKKSINK